MRKSLATAAAAAVVALAFSAGPAPARDQACWDRCGQTYTACAHRLNAQARKYYDIYGKAPNNKKESQACLNAQAACMGRCK